MSKILAICFFFLFVFAGSFIYRQLKYPPILISEKTDWYVIEEVNPPKHVYVSLRRESDNLIFKNQYVSKHFNDYDDYLLVGRRLKLTLSKYKTQSVEFEQFDNLRMQLEEGIR